MCSHSCFIIPGCTAIFCGWPQSAISESRLTLTKSCLYSRPMELSLQLSKCHQCTEKGGTSQSELCIFKGQDTPTMCKVPPDFYPLNTHSTTSILLIHPHTSCFIIAALHSILCFWKPVMEATGINLGKENAKSETKLHGIVTQRTCVSDS